MPTVIKAKRPTRRSPVAKKALPVVGIGPRRTPPPARGKVSDLLAMGDGFGKGADWEIIVRAHESRDL